MELWAHQKSAVELAKERSHLALLFETGTGKSATIINILRNDYNSRKKVCNTVIFTPLSVCPQFKQEFARFSKISPDDILVLTGPGAKRVKQLEARMATKKPCIVITNYESVQIKAFYEALGKFAPEIVVLDESQRCKDASGVRSKKLFPLCLQARRRFIMSGTPILNSMLDIFGQFKLMDPTIFGPNFFLFRTKYFYDKNARLPSHIHFPDWQPRPEAAKKIGQLVSQASVHAKKSECLDLPPLLKIKIPVELSPSQRAAYESMAKEFVAEIDGVQTVAEFAMTKTLRMQQILAGFVQPSSDEDPAWVDDLPRMQALRDLLESIGGKKTIIWTTFRPTYKEIAKVCDSLKLKYVLLTGEQSANEKQQAIEDFCRGNAQVIISNPAAGGVGVNLTEAGYAIYYSRGYSLEHFLQSEARNFRGGSDIHEKIVHYHIVAPGTLDEVIAEALESKQNVADSVLNWAKKQGVKRAEKVCPV